MIKKINTEELRKLLKEDNKVSLFEKHLIQEGVKNILFGNQYTSQEMILFLKDNGIINPLQDVEDYSNKIVQLTKKFKKEPSKEVSWNYNGLENNANFFGTQRDWNQTLLNLILKLSHEYMGVGKEVEIANFLVLSYKTGFLLDNFDGFHSENYTELKNCVYLGEIGKRFKCITLKERTEEDFVLLSRFNEKLCDFDNLSLPFEQEFFKIKIENLE